MSYKSLVKDIRKAESKLAKITSQSAFKKIEAEIKSASKNRRIFLAKKYSKISELKKRGVKVPPKFQITIHDSTHSYNQDNKYTVLGIPVTLGQITRGRSVGGGFGGSKPNDPKICVRVCRPPRRPEGSPVCTNVCTKST